MLKKVSKKVDNWVHPSPEAVGEDKVGVFQIGSDDSIFTNQKVYIWNSRGKAHYFNDVHGNQGIDVISAAKFVQKNGYASWEHENDAWTVEILKPIPTLKLSGGEKFKYERTTCIKMQSWVSPRIGCTKKGHYLVVVQAMSKKLAGCVSYCNGKKKWLMAVI